MQESDGDDPAGEGSDPADLLRPYFDAAFYAEQYRDLTGDAERLLRHYCDIGWREGRDPCPAFNTLAYLDAYPDTASKGGNPFYHYLLIGAAEGRRAGPAFSPRAAAERWFGFDPGDWVALLRPEIDTAHYHRRLGPLAAAGVDPAAHFAYRGWREGFDPSGHFSVAAALERTPALREAGINPLLDDLLQRPQATSPAPEPDPDDPGLQISRFPRPQLFGIAQRLAILQAERSSVAALLRAAYSDPVEHAVAAEFDAAYYLANYADVRDYGADPVQHYCRQGWAERRNPAAWFDTAAYLSVYPDVAATGANPFWHFLTVGRAEGRVTAPPRKLAPAAATAPQAAVVLDQPRMERLIAGATASTKGLVLALSATCYVKGGPLRLAIADEQARFTRGGLAYLHLSPAASSTPAYDLVMNGRLVGAAGAQDLCGALAAVCGAMAARRIFVIHSLAGHPAERVAALQADFGADANILWLNDAANLEAAALRPLLEAQRFHVAAPSRAMFELWQGAGLPHLSAQLHPLGELVPAGPAETEKAHSGVVRVVFAGCSPADENWPFTVEMASRLRPGGAYMFSHIGGPGSADPRSGLSCIVAEATPSDPDAVSRALRAADTDLVVLPTSRLEPFSEAAHEALAAGADVVCLAANVTAADLALSRGRGVVAEDEAVLMRFFSSLRAIEYVRLCRQRPPETLRLVRSGGTATLPLP